MYADLNSELFNKVLMLHTEQHSLRSYRVLSDIESVLSKGNKIDSELFEYLANNKNIYSQFRMREINDFLNIEGTDKNILKKYMDVLNRLNEKKYIQKLLLYLPFDSNCLCNCNKYGACCFFFGNVQRGKIQRSIGYCRYLCQGNSGGI